MKEHPRLPVFGPGVSTVVLVGIIWMFSAMAWGGTTPEGAVMVGDETCLDCHDDIGANYSRTLHGNLSQISSSNQPILCESCQISTDLAFLIVSSEELRRAFRVPRRCHQMPRASQ